MNEELRDLLLSILPELRCIRDCQFTRDKTTVIRPDNAAIDAADRIITNELGMAT